MITALAGGVGAARFLAGLVRCVEPSTVTAIVNSADDDKFYGLHVSPDIDSVIYTLAGASDTAQGWGLAGESFRTIAAIERFGAPSWFRLGDLDLATHIHRTDRLRQGRSLSEVTAELALAWGLTVNIVPMTNDPVATFSSLRRFPFVSAHVPGVFDAIERSSAGVLINLSAAPVDPLT